MYLRLLGLVVIIVATVVSVVVGFPPGVHRGRTRPGCRTGIPQENYQAKKFRSRTVMAVSLPAVLLKDDTARTQRRFELPTASIDTRRVQQIFDAVAPGELSDARRAQLQQLVNLLPENKRIDAKSIQEIYDVVAAAELSEARRTQLQQIVDLLPQDEPIDAERMQEIFDVVGTGESADARFLQLRKLTNLILPSRQPAETTPGEVTPSAPAPAAAAQPTTAASQVAELLPPEAAPRAEPEETSQEPEEPEPPPIKLFQLRQSQLRIDHCSLSRFALQLHEDGEWVLSLQADQNPRDRRQRFSRLERYNPQLYIKRNEFVVTVRCYGAFHTYRERLDQVTGKPVIGKIGPIKFWVENGQPKALRLSSTDAAYDNQLATGSQNLGKIELTTKEQFDLIDRIEVDFYYQ